MSYNHKHNEANGEGNRDGELHNRSWNCGAEGPTSDPAVIALRDRQRRNFLVTLMLSQGIPMLLGGDEIGRTQQGNNNAYCQDNDISYFDWSDVDGALLEFTRALIRFRHRHPVFRRRRWFQGRPIHDTQLRDIGWFTPSGHEMSEEAWRDSFARSISVFLNGEGIPSRSARGERVLDDSFLLLFSAHDAALEFVVPPSLSRYSWSVAIDTDAATVASNGDAIPLAGSTLTLPGRSVVVLQAATAVEEARS